MLPAVIDFWASKHAFGRQLSAEDLHIRLWILSFKAYCSCVSVVQQGQGGAMTGFSAGMIAAMPQSSALAIQHRSGLRILFFRPLNIVNASGELQYLPEKCQKQHQP